jgi:hypothetical protein
MTLVEFTGETLDTTAKQIEAVFLALPENLWDQRLNDQSMSPSETMAHLTECCLAMQTTLAGGEHEWGSYTAKSSDPEVLMNNWRIERDKARKAMESAGEEHEACHAAIEYLALHDAYHVGQLCAFRLSHNPDWDAYSIYS